jgi:hypothetical protein
LNGLLTFTPLAILFLVGTGMMIFHKKTNGWLIAAIFILVTLVCASWKMWYFGCSLGQRSFIEYYAILAVPFTYLTTQIFRIHRFFVSALFFFVILLFVYFNLRYTISLYRFERCYYGSAWDWDHYLRSVERAGILSPVQRISSYRNDFENLALCPVRHPSMIFTRSGQYSVSANDKSGQTPLFAIRLDELGYPNPKMMDVETWVLKPGGSPTGAALCYTLNRGAEVLFADSQPIDSLVKEKLCWQKVQKTFIIPDVIDSTLQINIFIGNPGHTILFVDDLKVRYRYRWK